MKKLTSLFLALILAMSMGTMAFAEEPVTISFQTWNPGDDVYIHEIIESFEAEHPNIKEMCIRDRCWTMPNVNWKTSASWRTGKAIASMPCGRI